MCQGIFSNKMGSKPEVEYCKIFSWSLVAGVVLWVFPYLTGHYVDISYPYLSQAQIPFELIRLQGASSNSSDNHYCTFPSSLLKGIDSRVYDFLEEGRTFSDHLEASPAIQSGGVWQPTNCEARFESVIIVPYRDRPKQLQIFLHYLHPFLQRQQLHYRIIVVEQCDDKPFNRGRLLNIGFVEAMKLNHPNFCFIFHDVDLLPLDDRNIYACTHQPRHMYSAVDVFRYHLPYRSLTGGAFAILAGHFKTINGFSNIFEGWGGEDDDFSKRLQRKGLRFERFDPQLARYLMIPHSKEEPAENRFRVIKENEGRSLSEDGLTTLTYELLHNRNFPLYTRLYVR